VLSTDGGRPQRAIRRLWDDLVWGRGRRITYRFEGHDGDQATTAAFVTHGAADDLQPGGAVGVRYLAADPAVHRINGEPGLLLLSFRLLIAAALAALCVVWLLGQRSSEMRNGDALGRAE
jgi:hypothetical protein